MFAFVYNYIRTFPHQWSQRYFCADSRGAYWSRLSRVLYTIQELSSARQWWRGGTKSEHSRPLRCIYAATECCSPRCLQAVIIELWRDRTRGWRSNLSGRGSNVESYTYHLECLNHDMYIYQLICSIGMYDIGSHSRSFNTLHVIGLNTRHVSPSYTCLEST